MIVEQARRANVTLRKPGPGDQGYVASTWVHSLRNKVRSERPTELEANQLVDRMLDDETVRVHLAVDPVSEHTILGWIAYTMLRGRFVLHYVYVRDKMRRRGIGETLLEHVNPNGTAPMYTLRGPDAAELLATFKSARHMPIEDFLR